MKKIIESDLISIAHRILKLKDKSEIASLLKETELLHKKLILLQFYEENKFRLNTPLSEEKLAEIIDTPEEKEIESIFLTNDKTDDVVTFEEELITPIELNVTTAQQIDQAIVEETNTLLTNETTNENVVEFTPSIEETQNQLMKLKTF